MKNFLYLCKNVKNYGKEEKAGRFFDSLKMILCQGTD